MVALFLSRRVFDFLAGTGFKEDLDDVFAKLEATLRRKDFAAVRNLDRKVFDVNEARHLYEGRLEDVNDIITALLREERLRVTHEGVSRRQEDVRPRAVHAARLQEGPLPGGHAARATAARSARSRSTASARSNGCAAQTFEYPSDYRPEQITEGAFGLIRGKEVTRVRIWFDDKVARYVQRRMWHPTQRFRRSRAASR